MCLVELGYGDLIKTIFYSLEKELASFSGWAEMGRVVRVAFLQSHDIPSI